MINYEKIIDQISNKIDESKNIYLCSHVNPDGDSIGSLMALGLALEQLNKNIHFIKTDTIPGSFNFLPGMDRLQEYDDLDIELFIVLDSGNEDRIGNYTKYVEKAKWVINIDHHLDNNNFGDINLVDANASSTGEIVFKVLEDLGLKLNKDIATHLYTAISTDSGRFMYDNVDDRTHEIVARLIREGIEKDEINIKLYQNRSMAATKLFIEGIATLQSYNNDKIVTVKISQDLLDRTDTTFDEADEIISFIRNIDTVEVACVLKEIETDETRISLRSKRKIDVSQICNVFNGGGHERAAGCTIYRKIEVSEKLIVDEIEKAMESQ